MTRIGKALILTAAALALAGCAADGLRDLSSNTAGPDEFRVLPVKPLSAPPSYDALPPPTPGGANITDPTPRADAVAALGGNPAALAQTPVPARDRALIATTTRYGVEPGIRAELAQADAEFRRRQARFTGIRLFRTDRYNQAYRRQALDPFAETRRMRDLGIQTPSSPPERVQ